MIEIGDGTKSPLGEFAKRIDADFAPEGRYPIGQESDYGTTQHLSKYTVNKEEAKEREKPAPEQYNMLRKAAEVHRRVRHHAQKAIKPGQRMIDIAEMIERGTRSLLKCDSNMEAGIAFPTGLSLNNCAAHWTPNPGDETVLKKEDILKIDIGVHVKGHIIDSAFTLTFDNPTLEPLRDAVRAATETGVREAGIDVRLGELGGLIQETMESHEVTIKGKTHQVKSIRNLNGHTIGLYHIHAGKTVPIVASSDPTKMEEGDLFAIETFGSTGKGYVNDDIDCSHYMLNYELSDLNPGAIRLPKSRSLFHTIKNNFGTLAFCKRHLEHIGESKYQLSLKNLVDTGVLNDYPPLVDTNACSTAQFEHTLLLRPTCKEVLSRGDDY